MSMNPNDPSQFPQWAQPPQKKGMSGGTKVLFVVLAAFGILAVVCCGGVAITIWTVSKSFKPVTDPAAVANIAQGIIAFQPPVALKPMSGMEMTVPFVGQKFLTLAKYGSPGNRSTLWLAQLDRSMSGQNEAQMRAQLDAQMRKEGIDVENVRPEEQSTKSKTINGAPAEFKIIGGQDKIGRKRLLVQGTFQGRQGPATLLLVADPAEVSREDAERMIDSME